MHYSSEFNFILSIYTLIMVTKEGALASEIRLGIPLEIPLEIPFEIPFEIPVEMPLGSRFDISKEVLYGLLEAYIQRCFWRYVGICL